MTTDSRILVMQILDAVNQGIAPYVIWKYKQRYAGHYLDELHKALVPAEADRVFHQDNQPKLLDDLDVAGWLKIMSNSKEVFLDEIGYVRGAATRPFNVANAFNFVSELRGARNLWAHSSRAEQFSDDGLYRLAENATRLLSAIGAESEAQVTENILRSVGEQIYGTGDAISQKKLTVAEKNMAAAMQQATELQSRLKSARRTEATAKTQANDLRKKLDDTQNELTAAQQAASNAKKDLSAVEQKLHSAERRLAATEKALANRKTDAPRPSCGSNGRRSTQFAGTNLSGRNLSGKDLSGEDLSRANLTKANLRGANLSGAILRDADFSGADLTNAVLIGADFTGAKLSGVKLQGVRYEKTTLPNGELWTQSTNMRPFTTRQS